MAATSATLDPRTRLLLEAPIVPTLLRLAGPPVVVMVAQAAAGLIETWFVGKLGTDALAGMALVFPIVMLMQMISGGAIGGGANLPPSCSSSARDGGVFRYSMTCGSTLALWIIASVLRDVPQSGL